MKQTVGILAVVVAATLLPLPGPPAEAAPRGASHDFGFANDQMGVRMETTEPTQADPYVHVRFRRHDGAGKREVRIVESRANPRTPPTFSAPVRLRQGEKAVFTTSGAMPCAPERHPLRVSLQMRVKLPGRDWWPWFTYSREAHILMDC